MGCCGLESYGTGLRRYAAKVSYRILTSGKELVKQLSDCQFLVKHGAIAPSGPKSLP
jgi:hypothetical protein